MVLALDDLEHHAAHLRLSLPVHFYWSSGFVRWPQHQRRHGGGKWWSLGGHERRGLYRNRRSEASVSFSRAPAGRMDLRVEFRGCYPRLISGKPPAFAFRVEFLDLGGAGFLIPPRSAFPCARTVPDNRGTARESFLRTAAGPVRTATRNENAACMSFFDQSAHAWLFLATLGTRQETRLNTIFF